MKQNVMLRVATLGAGMAATGTALGMSLASKIALVALGVATVAGAGSYSLWALRRAPAVVASPARSSLPVAPERVEAPSVVMPEGAVAPVDVSPIDKRGSENAKKGGKRPSVSSNNSGLAATPVAAFDPEPELRVLRDAREDLRAGRPESAHRRLDEYGRQHGAGMLNEERKALSVIALCHWKPGPEARAHASEFLRASPDSPLAKRVRSACEKAKSSQ